MDKLTWANVRSAVAAFLGTRKKTSSSISNAETSPSTTIVSFRQIREEPHVMSIVYSMAANSEAMPFAGLAQSLQGQPQVQRVPIQPQGVASANEVSAKFEGALWHISTTVPIELTKDVEADTKQGHQHIFVSRQGQMVGYFVLSQ